MPSARGSTPCNPQRLKLGPLSIVLLQHSSFAAIRATSSVTFKVAGLAKNAAVVWLGVLAGDVIAPQQVAGYALTMAG